MPKSNGMPDLVGHDMLVFTTISDREPSLSTVHFTNLAPATTVEQEKGEVVSDVKV